MKTIVITGSSSGIDKDAEQTYAMREQVGDDAFIAGMKQNVFSEPKTSFSQN